MKRWRLWNMVIGCLFGGALGVLFGEALRSVFGFARPWAQAVLLFACLCSVERFGIWWRLFTERLAARRGWQ